MRKFVLAISILLSLAVRPAFAGSLNEGIQCPASVKAGTTLSVAVTYVSNSCCDQGNPACTIHVRNALVALIGNPGTTLTGLGLYGPFVRPFQVDIPPCVEGPVPPGAVPSIKVVGAVPAALAGKAAMVNVMFTSSNNQELGSGSCLVNVTP